MGLSLHCTRATDPREMGRLGWSGLVVRTGGQDCGGQDWGGQEWLEGVRGGVRTYRPNCQNRKETSVYCFE